MDRGKSILGKKALKGKGAMPPGDLFALGSKPSRSGDSGSQKAGGGTSGMEKKTPSFGEKLTSFGEKLASFGERKRESSSLLAPGASKKPKILASGQMFTPLGRPTDREADRRASPIPPISQAYEELAIEVDHTSFLSEVICADDNNDFERVEGLLCGAVKHLHQHRFKPDQVLYLALMHLAKNKPNIFNSETTIEAFCTLLRRDMSLNFKSKGNSLVSVLTCNVLVQAYVDESNWPDDFVKVFVDDSLGERVWVDRADCRGFVDNISTAFQTNMPKCGISTLDMKSDSAPGSASPVIGISEDDDSKMEIEVEKSGTEKEQHNIPISPRYPYQLDNIESFVMDIVREQLLKRQLMDASAKSLIKLMTATCGYAEVRQLAAQKLELWLQNPKLARVSQELLMSVCMNCDKHENGDLEVIAMLIKMRMKTKPLINHYVACIRELLGQHEKNLQVVLTQTIYNELSTSRNPNNMSLIGVMFQTKPETAAQILAEIFQELLTNKDDYLRALRALTREIVRTLRHDFNFSAFCLALMQPRTESKFTDMEQAFKERYVLGVADLVSMCILQAVTPSVREVVSALARGDRKDMEVLYSYQTLVATIQRDGIWWMHTIVPNFLELKQQEYIFCVRKVLFMEGADQYSKDNWPAEADRAVLLRLAIECPVLEDTLMRLFVIGLSRDLPLPPPDAVEYADVLIRRAANLNADGRDVLLVERLEFFDALLNLCTYRHPENITLPSGYTPPQLAISNLYWKAWIILLVISAFNPATFGLSAWENYPTLKCLIEMVMTNNYKFPPPTTAVDDAAIEEVRARERQLSEQEKQEILEFEGHLAASTTKVTITEANSLLIAQLKSMTPNGPARKPPQAILDQLRSLNDSLKIGQMLCRSRKPDFLLDIIQRQGTSQSMPWLAELVESSEGSLDVLPVQCLCEFLLHETIEPTHTRHDDESIKFEKHKKKQKLRKQQQLLSRLQTLVHDPKGDVGTTNEVLDYFLKRLASTQSANRALATKGLSLIVSRSELSPSEEGGRELTDAPPTSHKWLLHYMEKIPMFSTVKRKVCDAIRKAIQVESDSSLVGAYIVFLSRHCTDLTIQEMDELALDVAQLIVERTSIMIYMLPQSEGSVVEGESRDTLDAFLSLFVTYIRKAREPNTAGYTWSNTQDQIILQWETGESATMHILVVHAMIILLSYGPAHDESVYRELLEVWFPTGGKPPSAFLLDTSEEALLLPEWLKLRMIRSNSQPLINAALQDLEPSQLLVFVQSFGIPVFSMTRLLQCLDAAVTADPTSLKPYVMDPSYMTQLMEVQHRRGARGGQTFYTMLTGGKMLENPPDTEEMDVSPGQDSVWSAQAPSEAATEAIPPSHVVNMLLQAFDPSGRQSPDTETHYKTLKMSVLKGSGGVANVAKGLYEILSGGSGPDFVRAIQSSPKACLLLRLILARKNAAGLDCVSTIMEKLSQCCRGDATPLAMLVRGFNKASKVKAHTAVTSKNGKGPLARSPEKFMTEVRQLEKEGGDVEAMIGHSLHESLMSGEEGSAARLACSALLQHQDRSDSGFLFASTAALFVDWLELVEPEVVRSAPDLETRLLFCRQGVETGEGVGARHHSNQPYLLALLTHQCSWATLHRCVTSLLHQPEKRFDPVSVLDFLWACIHVPKLWQGRERRTPKNVDIEDVLGLTGPQLVVLVHYIIEEANNLLGAINHKLSSTNQNLDKLEANEMPATLRNRMPLLKACVCDQEEKVKAVVDFLEKKIKDNSDCAGLYGGLLRELYLQYPYLLAWISDTSNLTAQPTISNAHTQMDLISHRLLTGLYQPGGSTSKIEDVNIACRKLASHHPTLMLRQLPAIVGLLKGKTGFTFTEFRQRNLLLLYEHVLGILELLVPAVFEHKLLNTVLDEYFSFLQAYGQLTLRKLVGLISRLVQFLNQYVGHRPVQATALLQMHVIVLNMVSSHLPELSVLKSLLAGLSLPRKERAGPTPGSSNVLPSRPASPLTMSHMGPFLHRIRKDNSEEVLNVLQDIDETSKRKLEILEHFVEDLKRLMLAPDDACRNTAFELTKRLLQNNPKKAEDFVPTFLHCLENDRPDIVMSALTNLPEFTLLCQEYATVILQRALTAGICSSIETSSYISESLQLLNLDLASG
ncbi:integrator complex subunit 1-like [Mya arenaria]|uniref:integrator complex subunit 1-like n=1 Tax=Mya arenaria TaxID=6604 RepID=UPI0022E392B3|nr:integrator complex subunit 1-like [Mya arenaria]